MKRFIKSFVTILKLTLGIKCREAVDEGLVDYSGQGRDKYGA